MEEIKYYYISMDLKEGTPCYDFVIKAKNIDEAKEIANGIIWKDYPEEMSLQNDMTTDTEETLESFWCEEVTADRLLEILTVN